MEHSGEPKAKRHKRNKKSKLDIPLPPEPQASTSNTADTGATVPPEEGDITERDYDGVDFMRDEENVFMNTQGETGFQLSNRIVVCSYDGQATMLSRAGSSESTILEDFKTRMVDQIHKERAAQTPLPYVDIGSNHTKCSCGKNSDDEESDESSASDDSDDDDDEEEEEEEEDRPTQNVDLDAKRLQERVAMETAKMKKVPLSKMEIDRKRKSPNGIHPDVCFNEAGLSNDGTTCRCSFASRTKGLRHGFYSGEERIFNCARHESNLAEVYHYVLRVSPFPSENQISKTCFLAAGEEYQFEGFSFLTHEPLSSLMPRLPLSRWSQQYEFEFVHERLPDDCFTIAECDILYETIFHDIFEMRDFETRSKYHENKREASCPVIHLMPRFVTRTGNFVKLMPLKGVMAYILHKYENELIDDAEVYRLLSLDEDHFIRQTNRMKQNLVIRGDKTPCAIRIDGFERDYENHQILIVHNTVKPTVYTTAQLSRLQYLERRIKRQTHLINTRGAKFDPEMTEELNREAEDLRNEVKQPRLFRMTMPLRGYRASGFFPDAVAHVLMCILATHHVRYQMALTKFEEHIGYQFQHRNVVELAMTHSSFQNNYGTTSDHAKNLISNCGYRRKYIQEERKDKKKGIVNLLNIMSSTGTIAPSIAEQAPINHNERLEYLGDAVVEMIVTNHLYFMLPHHNEGGLATYRTSIVQNRNLATLAKNLHIDEFIQFSHGIELCHEADFRHALANAYEALIGAIYLDGGIEHCDRVFSLSMYCNDPQMKTIWDHVNEHELKREDPQGDRQLARSVPTLEALIGLEDAMGIEFNNIRVLAKSLTRRSVPTNDLTRGHNQRLEWLGDTVLQLIITDYLYRNFPYHHEGHMSLLRTSLVSNQTQAKIFEDLGLIDYIIKAKSHHPLGELRTKDKADFVEALIGALFVDRGIEHCRSFVRICFLPRLAHFISTDKWNDPKSHLQQWCLTLRDASNPNPQIPEYRVIRVEGPTNTRVYTVAVYFRNKKLAHGEGSNVHMAELNAAQVALAQYEGSNFQKIKQMTKKLTRKERRAQHQHQQQQKS